MRRDDATPANGAHAPAIELPRHDGGHWSLTDQRGRPTLVIFHRHIH